jgi:tetratricopeptide (TPR) repeat protein
MASFLAIPQLMLNDALLKLVPFDKYTEAQPLYEKALTVRRKLLGEEHPDTAKSYFNMAYILNVQGKYTEAQPLNEKSLAICRKVLGEHHLLTAQSYHNLANNLYFQGKYAKAEECNRKALPIIRKVQGEDHPDTAKSYNDLANTLNARGKYTEEEECNRKALAIFRKALGEEHPETAQSYNSLGDTLNAQGRYAEAEEDCRKALAISRKVQGERHLLTAACYNNLAMNLDAEGKYAEGEENCRKALDIFRKVAGEENPNTAASYNNLAMNLSSQGKLTEGEANFRRALTLRRQVLGEEHPDTLHSYNNLGDNLNAQGKYAEAEEDHRKALTLYRKLLGEGHPSTAACYHNLAVDLAAQGKYAEAEKYWLRAADAFAKSRLHLAPSGLERATKTSERSPLPWLAAVLARNGKPADAWQRFEESLSCGTWDDLSARLRRPPAEQAKQAQLVARLDHLDKLIEGTISAEKPTPEQTRRREELLTQQRQAQDELAAFTRHLEDAYGPAAGKVSSREKIQVSLLPDAALVGWLDLPEQPHAADPNGEHWVVLLRSAGPPVWLRLRGSGEKGAWADADSRLPDQLRAALQSPSGDWQPLAERLRRQRLQPLAPHLAAMNGLPAVRRLIVLPSTALVGLPVEVIADQFTVSYAHSGTMYAHRRQQPAPTGRGLFALADPVFETPVNKETPQPLPPGGVLLTMVLPGSNAHQAGLKPNDVLLRYNDKDLAGPADFKPLPGSSDPNRSVPVAVWREGNTLPRPLQVRPGKLGVAVAADPAPQALAEQRRWDRRLASRGGEGGQWDRLPGTRFEVASLHRLFGKDQPAEVLMDSDASEQRLYELARVGALGKYRYLHLATHGQVDDVFPLRSAVILSRDRLPDAKERERLLLDGQPIPDGRLTAEEVLRQWDLRCELVTLSACQTALGKYERGEGFVGFAQALVLSGSRSVCLSLWEVPDAATALLMERFYQNLLGKRDWLKAPLPKAAALAEAKAWLRQLPRAEAIRRATSLSEGVERGPRKKLPPLEVPPADKTKRKDPPKPQEDRPYAHPYYWAAFVLLGDPE